MKKYFIILSILWCSSNYSQVLDDVQNKIDKTNSLWGDYYFLNSDYQKAIKFYTQIKIDKTIESQRNLAAAYEKTEALDASKKVYESVTKSDEVSVIDYYKFASLLSNEYFVDESGSITRLAKEYKEKAFKLPFESYSLYENDSSVYKKRFSKSNYSLINLNTNSENSDFGAFIIPSKKSSKSKRKLIFSTKQEDNSERLRLNKRVRSELPIYNLVNTDFDINDFNTGEIEIYPPPINSQFQEGPASFNSKNNKLYFTRSAGKIDKNSLVQLNIYSIILDLADSLIPELLSFNIDGFSTLHPSVSNNLNKIFFASDRPGGYGGMDIYYVDILKNGFSEPVNLGKDINTEKDEVFPFIYKGKYLFFSSDGRESLGNLDIFLAQLITDNRWKVFLLGNPYNTKKDDFSFFMSDEKNYGFLSSNRKNGKGEDDIYAFKFSPKIEGLKDNYVFSPSDTLIVANDGVLVNDKNNMIEYDPLQILVEKKVSLMDSVRNGKIKFNDNGTFLYKSKNNFVAIDSFSYAINTAYGNSKSINVILNKSESKDIRIENLPPIFFDFNKFNLLNKYKTIVDDLVEIMNLNPEMVVEISSFADCRGTKKYNLSLSDKRSNTIINYVRERVINKSRISGKGYGEINKKSKKDCDCCKISEQEHLLDRRTEFKIISY